MNAQDYMESISSVPGLVTGNRGLYEGALYRDQRDRVVDGINIEIGVWKGKCLGAIIAISPDRD